MRIDVFTIFPHAISKMAELSVLGRAQGQQKLDVRAHDLRMNATDPHKTVDDKPFGGGPGMILKAEPVFQAVETVDPPRPLFLLDPVGSPFDQSMARDLAALSGFSLLCGRYEGVDQRIREELVDATISIGDFVMAGGEFAAMVIVETVARLIPGVLGNDISIEDESFGDGLLEYPQWTRPAEFREMAVPEVLRSGDHARIERWRRAASIERTATLRPDLLDQRGVSPEEIALLKEFNISIDDRFLSD